MPVAYDVADVVHLNDNLFTGTIPNTIGSLSSLQYLELSCNIIGGTIPESFYNLATLEFAYFANNTLTGTISN